MAEDVTVGSNPAEGEVAPNESDVAEVNQGTIEQAPAASAREAIDRAFDTLDQDGEQPASPNHDPATGKFIPGNKAAVKAAEQQQEAVPVEQQPAAPAVNVPSRFTKEAQAEWAKVPGIVQQEIDRAIAEMTQGIEKYKADADLFDPLRQYHELAQRYNVPLSTALQNYIELDTAWQRDPVQGFFQTCQKAGVDPDQLFQAIYGNMPPSQQQSQQMFDEHGQPVQAQANGHDNPAVLALHQRIAAMNDLITQQQNQLQNLGQTFQQSQEQMVAQQVNTQVEDFKKDHPYYAELEPTMVKLWEAGIATTLSDAYDNAARLIPEIHAKIEADKAAATAANKPAQNGSSQKAQLSITGTPSGGSNPTMKPAGSPREAIDRALASIGYS